MADTKGEYYYGMGRRKTAVARVRLFPNGDGSITVNGKPAQNYFGLRDTHLATIAAPLRALDLSLGMGISGRLPASARDDTFPE